MSKFQRGETVFVAHPCLPGIYGIAFFKTTIFSIEGQKVRCRGHVCRSGWPEIKATEWHVANIFSTEKEARAKAFDYIESAIEKERDRHKDEMLRLKSLLQQTTMEAA